MEGYFVELSVRLKLGLNFLFSITINFFLKIKYKIGTKNGINITNNRHTVFSKGILNLVLRISKNDQNHNKAKTTPIPILK